MIAMARKAREKSEQNIYHVMLRGINHQQIFMDDVPTGMGDRAAVKVLCKITGTAWDED